MKIENVFKSLNYDDYTYKEVMKGRGIAMCPNCLNLVPVYLNYDVECACSTAPILITRLLSAITCDECGTTFEQDLSSTIDINMAKSIQMLNQKGYPTKFSCEGHFDGDEAYIMFGIDAVISTLYENAISDIIYKAIKPYPLMDMWHIDENDYLNKDMHAVIIRSHPHNAEEKERSMEQLDAWVRSLPQLDVFKRMDNARYDAHYAGFRKANAIWIGSHPDYLIARDYPDYAPSNNAGVTTKGSEE